MTAEMADPRSPKIPGGGRQLRRWWLLAMAVVLVFGVVSVAGYAFSRGREAADLPEGWQVIRPPREVSALAEWSGLVWAGGVDGLCALDMDSGSQAPEAVASLEDAGSLRYVSSLLVDRRGRLWVGHEAGLTMYASTPPVDTGGSVSATGASVVTVPGGRGVVRAVSYGEAEGLPDSMVRCLLEDAEGRIWAGTHRGAVAIEDGRITVLDSTQGLLADSVSVMLEDSSGGLWFGSTEAPRGGLSLLLDGSWQYFTSEDGLPHNNVNALLEDGNGAVWVATGYYDRGGVARLVARLVAGGGSADDGAGTAGRDGWPQWVVAGAWDRTSGMPGAKARSLYQAEDGSLWLGTEYDGVLRVGPGVLGGEQPAVLRGHVFNEANGLTHNEVKVLLQDVNGNLWLGTYDGITRIAKSALARLAETGED